MTEYSETNDFITETPPGTTGGVSDGKKKANARRRAENIRGWAVVGPLILYYAIFGIIPLVMVFRYSFYEDSLFGDMIWVGLRNYTTFFTNKDYYVLLFDTMLIALFTIGFSLVFGLLLAKLMTGSIRGKGFYRTVYYLPVVVSMAVIAQIANVWLSYNNGTVNNVLVALGKDKIEWKQSTGWMYFWIIAICTWKGLGATVILFVAGLSGISTEIYEAADVDGANKFIKFFKITLPQLKPMFVFVLITSIIGAFNIFEPVQLISGGGPDGSTKVVLFQIYNEAFQNGNNGMASAISVILLIIMFALTVLNMKWGESKD